MPSADEFLDAGNRHLREGRFADARLCYEQALAMHSGFAEAMSNMGVAFADEGRHEEALACYDRAINLGPNTANVYFNRGNSLVALGRPSDALHSFEAALRQDPQFIEALTNRGVLLRRMGYVLESLECHRRVLQSQPNSADAHSNLALCLGSMGRVDEALDHYHVAMRLQPDNAGARCNRAQLLLLKADFRHGWPEYESRWALERARLPDRGLPRWNGAPLDGKGILLRHEQGFGDTIMFCRYAAAVEARGGRVVLECPRRLHRLIAKCAGISKLTDGAESVSDVACEAPLLSLPGIFGTNFRTIPGKAPYLFAETERVRHWASRLPAQGIRIGIAWQGNPEFPEDAMRSVPLRHFAPLAGVAGVRLISLQMGKGAEQIQALADRLPIIELGPDLDRDGAFLDTAAVMMNLDLVVSSDTAIIHLAGGLARPAWLALSTGPDWRWLRDRDDSPWYPTIQLFRQDRLGDWDSVFDRIREQLCDSAGKNLERTAAK